MVGKKSWKKDKNISYDGVALKETRHIDMLLCSKSTEL